MVPAPSALSTSTDAAGQPGPLAQQPEADVPPAVGPDRRRVEAGPLVADGGHDRVVLDPQDDAGVVDVGVLDDVEQRLLEEAVDGDRGRERQRVRPTAGQSTCTTSP